MTAQEVYELMLFIIKKNKNGSLSPDEFNLNINIAQKSYVSFLLGPFQYYQDGRPIARVELGNNGVIRERLSPFIGVPVSLTVDSTIGVAPYPEDYIATDAMYYTDTMKRVKCIGQDRLDSHLNSVIDPISDNPVYLFVSTGYLFYPNNITGVKLSYIKTPPDIVYAIDDNGNYDPANSDAPLWSELDIMEIVVRALQRVGVNLQSGNIQQYSQLIKQTGQ